MGIPWCCLLEEGEGELFVSIIPTATISLEHEVQVRLYSSRGWMWSTPGVEKRECLEHFRRVWVARMGFVLLRERLNFLGEGNFLGTMRVGGPGGAYFHGRNGPDLEFKDVLVGDGLGESGRFRMEGNSGSMGAASVHVGRFGAGQFELRDTY